MVFLALACQRDVSSWHEMESNAALQQSWELELDYPLWSLPGQGNPRLSHSQHRELWIVLCRGSEGNFPSATRCCTSEDLWHHTFLLEDGGAISAVFLALLSSALQVSLSGVPSKYWPGWTLLISGNQWHDSPRYCSKKASKEICICLWLFSTSINMFPWSNGIVTIGSNYCGCIHLLWFNQTGIIC